MAIIRFGTRSYRLPASRMARVAIGLVLIVFGILGFLPVLGFWMIPLGLIVLSVDLPPVRRFRRRWTVKLGGWLKRNYPALAERIGFDNGNGNRGGAGGRAQK